MQYDFITTDAQAREFDARMTARAEGDARCDLIALCEGIALSVPRGTLTDDGVKAIAASVCEDLYHHPDYGAVLNEASSIDGWRIAEETMLRAYADSQQGAAA